jgi:hypothetical protein
VPRVDRRVQHPGLADRRAMPRHLFSTPPSTLHQERADLGRFGRFCGEYKHFTGSPVTERQHFVSGLLAGCFLVACYLVDPFGIGRCG